LKAYIITIKGNELSEESAKKTLESAIVAGLDAEIWYGIDKYTAVEELKNLGLQVNNKDGLITNYSYLDATIGCFLSHYYLWVKSVQEKQRFVILEHDVKFTDKFEDRKSAPGTFNLMNIGKPLWGEWTNADGQLMEANSVDNLAGSHAYIINPIIARKLIESAKESGVIPTDKHISNANLWPSMIEDVKPYCCTQMVEFTTIQKTETIRTFHKEHFIPAKESWGKDESQVMVFLADESMFDKIPPLIQNAINDGLWSGDFLVLTPPGENTKYLEDRNIAFFQPQELYDTPIHFYKMFMFDGYLKDWDWVLYVDLDIWFTSPIELKIDERDRSRLYARKDNLKFMNQFYGANDTAQMKGKYKKELTKEQSDIKSKIQKEYGDVAAFQTCFMLWHTNINDDMFVKLKENYFKYYVYYELARAKHWEQQTFNLTFYDGWDLIGKEWTQTNAMEEVGWDIEKLKEGYSDGGDYEDTIAVHFTQWFPPWEKFNKRFFIEWSKYNEV